MLAGLVLQLMPRGEEWGARRAGGHHRGPTAPLAPSECPWLVCRAILALRAGVCLSAPPSPSPATGETPRLNSTSATEQQFVRGLCQNKRDVLKNTSAFPRHGVWERLLQAGQKGLVGRCWGFGSDAGRCLARTLTCSLPPTSWARCVALQLYARCNSPGDSPGTGEAREVVGPVLRTGTSSGCLHGDVSAGSRGSSTRRDTEHGFCATQQSRIQPRGQKGRQGEVSLQPTSHGCPHDAAKPSPC